MDHQHIRVNVMLREGRKYFEAWWIDPVTGLKKTRSTKQTRRREAERFAAKLEERLKAGESTVQAVTWSEFRAEYERNVFPAQRPKTRSTTVSTLNAIERICRPARVASIDEEVIRRFTSEIRKEVGSEFSVARHLRELRKVLRWGADNRLLRRCPKIRIPETKGRKGRDVTPEEFERLLAAVEKTKLLRKSQWSAYKFFLRGLYWGGLRLGEALLLDWEDDTNICVEIDRRRPMFRIQAATDKGGQYRVLPMAPEFALMLREVPKSERSGRVFKLPCTRGEGFHQEDRAKHVLIDIGKVANVKVSEGRGGRPKFASAHDLRRAFGVRWSQRVLPPVLMEMMRHSDIKTTMQFYVGRNAERSAADAWLAFEQTRLGDKSGDSVESRHLSDRD